MYKDENHGLHPELRTKVKMICFGLSKRSPITQRLSFIPGRVKLGKNKKRLCCIYSFASKGFDFSAYSFFQCELTSFMASRLTSLTKVCSTTSTLIHTSTYIKKCIHFQNQGNKAVLGFPIKNSKPFSDVLLSEIG